MIVLVLTILWNKWVSPPIKVLLQPTCQHLSGSAARIPVKLCTFPLQAVRIPAVLQHACVLRDSSLLHYQARCLLLSPDSSCYPIRIHFMLTRCYFSINFSRTKTLACHDA